MSNDSPRRVLINIEGVSEGEVFAHIPQFSTQQFGRFPFTEVPTELRELVVHGKWFIGMARVVSEDPLTFSVSKLEVAPPVPDDVLM